MIKRVATVLTPVLLLAWLAVQATAGTNKKAEPNAVFRAVQDDPTLPRVLLIGDSISIGYTLPVRQLLSGKANVHRIPMNGGDTARGLKQLDAWLGDKPWDVIHFNWGLHDLKRLKDGKLDATASRAWSPEAYASNLDELVVRLKKTGATLVWATITPVPEGSAGRIKGDEVVYNQLAANVMAKHGVKVNDLWGYIMPKLARTQNPKNVHFSKKGSALLANQVAKAITAALNERASADSPEKP
ncbi:MAG: SGNH/GDSL hydrolase family protein [Pirellulales bacterium]|nr:SGNH/GDSL hydrolase family protein [Pirellulales bacterium]